MRYRSTVFFGLFCLLLTLAIPVVADQELDVDIACNGTTFVFQGPTTEAGPANGASFVVQGFIYPAGTFADKGAGSGVLPNGEPEFPELVIGTWTCQGHFIGDGFATTSGPFVVTTQLYDLDGDDPGTRTLVSHGVELIDLNVPFERGVTGGTGEFNRAEGQVTQTAIGVNDTGLFNFTFQFRLE